MRLSWYVSGVLILALSSACQLRLARNVGQTSEGTVPTTSAPTTSANVSIPTLSPSTKTLMVGNSATFTAANGVEPYSFSIVSGGGSVSSTGLYTASGTAGTVVIRVTDAAGQSADATITVVGSLQFLPVALPTLAQNRQFSVIGGVSPYTFSQDSGPGSIDPTGLFTRPWETGTSVIRVTDSLGNTTSTALTLPPGSFQLFPGSTKTLSGTQFLRDSSGNFFMFGLTSGVVGTQYGTHGTNDAYVAKFDSKGALIWASQLGSGTAMGAWGAGTGIDSSGNPFISGSTTGVITGGTQYGAHGSNDGYAAKFNGSTGTLLWASQIGAAGQPFYVYRAASDSSGNIYIGGRSGGIIGTQIGTHGSRDHGLVKFDTSGNKAWSIQLGAGVSNTAGWYGDIKVDNAGNVYVNGREDFGTFSGVSGFLQVGTHSNNQESYVWKVNSSGTHQWVAQLGGGPTSLVYDGTIYLEANQSGAYNIYVSGSTDGTVGTQIGTHGSYDAFIWSLTSAGANRWVKQLGGGAGKSTQAGWYGKVEYLDSSNNIYVVGTTTGSLGGTQVGTHSTGTDSYVWKLNSAGTHQWVIQMGGGGANAIYPSRNIAFESSGSILVAGTTPASLGGTQYGVQGSTDLFLWKISSAGAHQRVTQWGGGASSTAAIGDFYLNTSTGDTFLWGTSTGSQGATQYGTHGATDAVFMKIDSTGVITASQLGGGGSSVLTPGFCVADPASGVYYVQGTLTAGGSLDGSQYGTLDGGDVGTVTKWNSTLQQQ